MTTNNNKKPCKETPCCKCDRSKCPIRGMRKCNYGDNREVTEPNDFRKVEQCETLILPCEDYTQVGCRVSSYCGDCNDN